MTDVQERLVAALSDRYAIERELGAGGMATVYLADDLRHERKVALKVLRPELGAVLGGDRFLQEIRLTARLQHPNILPLFDSGEADGLLFYVMPYIEGESLRDKLERETELHIDDAVKIAAQVASALDYAHRHEVIHRDIKPENILVHDGQALVADFGIALAVRAAGGDRLTETGLSLGTPQYMSPEQAMADREIDARSDIYSLGCVLYEMLAGEAPYTGPSAQAIIAKIITEDPRPLRQGRKTVPPHVEAAVHKTLQKLPGDRFHSAAEFADALTKPSAFVAEAAAVAAPAASAPSESKRASRLAWPALALVAAALAIWGWSRSTTASDPDVVARFVVTLPAHEQLGEAAGNLIAIAPDGSKFVYVGVGPNGRRLYLRSLDSFEAKPLPGTEDAARPFFSPDGRWVGFSGGGETRKVELAGGPPVKITDGINFGASWGDDDNIVFSPVARGGLFVVSAAGGTPEPLTTADSAAGEIHRTPHILPDGKSVLFVAATGSVSRIGVASLRTGDVKYLIEGARPHYAPSGHLVYATADGLWAAPFDIDRLEVVGPAIAFDLDAELAGAAITEFSLSRNGSLAYQGGDERKRSLVTVDRRGREVVLTPELRAYDGPRYSPDGRRIALRIFEGGDFHIWVYEIGRSTFSRLTFEPDNFYPVWTPDGSRVSFVTDRDGDADIYWKPADGSGSEEPVVATELAQWDISWAPDGRRLVYRQNHPETGRDLWTIALDGKGEPQPLLRTPSQERAPMLSPDGRFLAYVSDESGRAEVYVQTFPQPGGKWQISTEGGTEPLWSRDGRELFYRHDDQIVAVAVQTDPVFTSGAHKTLFTGPYVPNPTHTNYDIHPNGDRFIMVKSAEGEQQVVIVLNWRVELERRTGS